MGEHPRRALLDSKPFDTLSVLGVESRNGLFARTFESHGFYRQYELAEEDAGRWLPLCDRVAKRVEDAPGSKRRL